MAEYVDKTYAVYSTDPPARSLTPVSEERSSGGGRGAYIRSCVASSSEPATPYVSLAERYAGEDDGKRDVAERTKR
jgi:hypothetical protein